jgi:hypothetical protein
MGIYEHLATFVGYTITDREPGQPLKDPATTGYALRIDWEASEEGTRWTDIFADFLKTANVEKVEALVVGAWDFQHGEDADSARVVEALVAAHPRLPALKALFLGDITSEENEISWIRQSDMSPLLAAYPHLEHFGVRGGEGLTFGTLKHSSLKSLIVQTGGMDRSIVQSAARAKLPRLERLELWTGSDSYGWNGTMEDVQPLLHQNPFPALRYLGLRNSEIVDDIAVEIANAPVLKQIQTLDLSLGILTDKGAEALVNSPLIRGLKKLDLHHHYCSQDMIKHLKELPVEVDVSEPQSGHQYQGDDEVYRYIAVSE